MSRPLLVRGARQLVTLFGSPGPRRGQAMRELAIIVDGAMLIRDGVIQEVGPSRRVEMLSDARDAIELDASGKVVMPGFIDSVAHPLSGPLRLTHYDHRDHDCAAPESIMPSVSVVRTYSTQRLEMEGRKVLRNFTRYGTTTLGGHTGFGLDESTEMKSLRVLNGLNEKPLAIVPVFAAGHACPDEFADRPEDYLDLLATRILPLVKKRRLAKSIHVRCGRGGFSVPSTQACLSAARQLGLSAVVQTDSACAGAAVSMAIEQEAASVILNGAIPETAAAPLADAGLIATLLPGRQFHSGAAPLPLRQYIDLGIPITLSTGFDSFRSPTSSLPIILSLACSGMGLLPAEAVTAATLNAAYALGVADSTGSLQYGKNADFLLLSVPDYREIPFSFGMNPLAMAFRRGQQVFPRVEAL